MENNDKNVSTCIEMKLLNLQKLFSIYKVLVNFFITFRSFYWSRLEIVKTVLELWKPEKLKTGFLIGKIFFPFYSEILFLI